MDGQLKQEIQDLITKVLTIFTTEYTTNYTLGIVNKVKEDSKKAPSPYKLLTRPDDAKDKSDIYKGYLTKEGGFRKSWKKRYFVIRHDYSIDYYVDENECNKANNSGKKKGTINLCGYKVNKDPNKSTLERLRKVCSKMGMDQNNMPKGKEYPPHTVELYHPNRRSYYITAGSSEDCKAWRKKFKKACRNAYGFKNRDPIHVEAFGVAVRNTRWALGRWGWWSWGGSEIQVLTDVITDELEYDLIGRVLGKLPSAPYAIRDFLRRNVMKSIDGIVSSSVSPAWMGMDKTVTSVRPIAEPKIKDSVDPIFKVENEINQKMREGLMSVVEPVIKEHVVPHAHKIIKMVRKPIQSGFHKSHEIWEESAKTYDGNGSTPSSFHFLDYLIWGQMAPARKKIVELQKDLDTLSVVFPDISGFWITYDIKEKITNVAHDASYTFEHLSCTDEAHDVTKAREETLQRHSYDIEIHYIEQIQYTVRAVVKEPLLKIVNPLCSGVISSLGSIVPDPLKDFVNINEMFDKFIDDMINDVTKSAMHQEESD
ncbi:pleckstrin (PH) domain-containing protein [Tieghemostelium lacteum]|uniref:Pleckstrin (PH) domain-containing protein n=1 Tax=Tieghemostelium lacteum TaxID=361077 RepID=A0A151Z9W5_TIELA|nr:pleckstrin (PH) domain-containing protein [Tieghemostelium lacteum]|eukprot:KYQ90725.1 pleckstrin (PH) domain-containing protein [Tieghemostelium lacteum]